MLTDIILHLTEDAEHNKVALEIQMRTALHLIIGHWIELIQAGETSKTRYSSHKKPFRPPSALIGQGVYLIDWR